MPSEPYVAVGGNPGNMPSDWSIPYHSHNCHEMVFVVNGVIETTMQGRTFVCPRGSAKLHPAGVSHHERALEGVPPGLIWILWKDFPGIDPSTWPQSASDPKGRLRMLFEWMFDIAADPAQKGTLEYLARSCFAEYSAIRNTGTNGMIAKVCAFVQRRMTQTIYLEDLARHVGMSKFYFTRVFGELTGQTPMEYVRTIRVEAARSMLLTSALPLRAIAPRVGFADEFQLSRVFRQVTGSSPGSVRRLSRKQPS